VLRQGTLESKPGDSLGKELVKPERMKRGRLTNHGYTDNAVEQCRHISYKYDSKHQVWFRDAAAYPLKLVQLAIISNGIVGTFGNLAS
jgi:hypothetical protein